MNYEDRVVCFLDVLGFKNHISSSIRPDGSDETEKITSLAEALLSIRDTLDVDRPEEHPENEVTQFSDSIVITFQTNTESGVFYALLSILWVQINLVGRGFLCRGGVTQGKLIHTNKLLFGPAMVEAYVLESEAALYPRVILDESIIRTGVLAHGRQHYQNDEAEGIMSLLSKDLDGMYYIDYITKAQSELNDPNFDNPVYLSVLRNIIKEGLRNANPSVSIKYKWLREKLAPHLLEVKAAAARMPEGDKLREAYERIPDL